MEGTLNETGFLTTSTPISPTDPSEILTCVSCGVSLCCGVIMLFLTLRRHISLGTCHFMFICLTIADMMTAGGNLYGIMSILVGSASNVPQNFSHYANSCIATTPQCKMQSFITTWSSMCCFLWTIVIEVYCFISIWKSRRHIPLSWSVKCSICLFCWLFPLAIVVAALLSDVLGQDNSATSGGWCWIASCDQLISKNDRILWMLFTGKLWEILSYLTISNLILLQVYKAYSHRHRRRFFFAESEATIIIPEVQTAPPASDSQSYELQKFLFWIPMLLILARIWGTIRFFLNVSEIVNDGVPDSVVRLNSVLLYFHGIGDSSQATCNFILAMIFVPCQRLLQSRGSSRHNSSISERSMYSVGNLSREN